jgi:hypothetical protein
MRHRRKITLIRCLIVLFAEALGIASSQGIGITFDDLGLGALDTVSTQYSSQGVTFRGISDAGAVVGLSVANNTIYGDANPKSSPFALSNFYDRNPLLRAHVTEILFSQAMDHVAFYYNGAGFLGSSTVFSIYDTSHTLINSFTVSAATNSTSYLVTVPYSNVGEIALMNPHSGWGYYIDNLSFTPVVVPDAGSTAGLLALGFAALAGLRRRKLD